MYERGDRHTTADLELVERDLDALLELSATLGGTADIEKTLLRIAELMAGVLESDRCSILLVDPTAKTGFIVASSDDAKVTHLAIELDVYPEIREAVRTGEPLVINDVHRAPIFDEVRDKIRDKPVGSTMLFPVRVDRHVQGVLHLRTERARTRPLTTRETRFGQIVANATGIAIRNARLYESVRDRSEKRLNERIQMERRLRQIEKYRTFFDLAGEGLAIVDGTGQILFANRASRLILGFDGDALNRVRLQDLVHEEGRGTLEEIMSGIREGRHTKAIDLSVMRADGARAVLSLTTSALDESAQTEKKVSPDRRSVTAIVAFRDVTETRAIEEELRQTKDFLENLIESSADAIVAADMSGKMVVFNEVAERITGYPASEAIGKHVNILYPEGVARQIMKELRSDQHGGRGKLSERQQNLRTKEGSSVPVNLAAAIVYDQNREVATVGIFSDLREKLKLEQELHQTQTQLAHSERQAAVVELAGAAAHELNQPLTSILGTVELLLRKLPADVPGSNYLPLLISECERMADIVRKLGLITRYETKHYVGSSDIIDLDAACEKPEETS